MEFAEPVIGGELCLRLKILDHGSVRTFDDSLRVCGFVTRPRPRSAGPGRAGGGGAAGTAHRGVFNIYYNTLFGFSLRFYEVFHVGDRNDRPIANFNFR